MEAGGVLPTMERDSCAVRPVGQEHPSSILVCVELGGSGVLPPRLGHADGADGAAPLGLRCHNSPEPRFARADPLGKTHMIIQRDLPLPAICVIVHWSSWKRVSLRYRTMQNLFLQCKSISMYKTFATSVTIYKPVASGNHMLLRDCDRFMPFEQWKSVVSMI